MRQFKNQAFDDLHQLVGAIAQTKEIGMQSKQEMTHLLALIEESILGDIKPT